MVVRVRAERGLAPAMLQVVEQLVVTRLLPLVNSALPLALIIIIVIVPQAGELLLI